MDSRVIVAGAGPAGAVAARTLALAGIDTLLVDRAPFPRNKPCGGGLTQRAFIRFPWLEKACDGIDVHRVARLHLDGPHGSSSAFQSDGPFGTLIRRVEFDHALVRQAVAAGARLSDPFEITQASADAGGVTLTSRDGRTLSAPIVVAADGVHSVIAKRLGVNQKWPRQSLAIDMMEETPKATLRADRDDLIWISYAYDGLDGYAYIFPKSRHVNVGIGCILSYFDEHVTAAPYDLQRGLIASLVASGRLHGASDRKQFTPYLIPVGGPLKPAHRGRVLFAGDAGGFVNAITAEGIYYAMIAGELAGKAIAEAGVEVAPGVAGRRYDRLWRKEIGAELRDAVFIQRYLFSSHARVARFVKVAGQLPWLGTMLMDYTKGEISYAALRRKIFARFPMTAVRLARDLMAARS